MTDTDSENAAGASLSVPSCFPENSSPVGHHLVYQLAAGTREPPCCRIGTITTAAVGQGANRLERRACSWRGQGFTPEVLRLESHVPARACGLCPSPGTHATAGARPFCSGPLRGGLRPAHAPPPFSSWQLPGAPSSAQPCPALPGLTQSSSSLWAARGRLLPARPAGLAGE